MENIRRVVNIMESILAGTPPEKLLRLLPYDRDELKNYYLNVAPNDTMGFFLVQLENWFYEHEAVVERENRRVFDYWQEDWSYPLFEKTEPAFFTDEPQLWQDFLDEMEKFVHYTKQLMQ